MHKILHPTIQQTSKTACKRVQYKASMSVNKLKNENGVVSIIVTIILMLVISLIVLGFAQVTRRNQRETLDRQLSTQAYYAAETGINDVVSNLKNITTSNPSYTTDCSGPNSLITALNSLTAPATPVSEKLNTDGTVKYTCLLINPNPTSIKYTDIPNQHVVTAPLNLNGPLKTLTIQWQAAANTKLNANACAQAGGFPAATAWTGACDYAMLHVDLTQVLAGSSAQTLADNTDAFYMVPQTGPGLPVAINSFTDNAHRATYVKATSCDAAGLCSATVSFPQTTQLKYAIRIGTIYNDAKNVRISGTVYPSGAAASFSGAVTVIDATGKAQDQLRRIQVQLSAQGSEVLANALQTTNDICKLMTITVSGTLYSVNDICSGVPAPSVSSGSPGIGNVPCSGNCSGPNIHNPFPQDTYHYSQSYQNNTTLNGSSVVSCLWNFGDGGTSTGSCMPGDQLTHSFKLAGDSPQYAQQVKCNMVGNVNQCVPTGASSIFPQGCSYGADYNKVHRVYTITLTVLFNDGSSKTSPPATTNFPYCY